MLPLPGRWGRMADVEPFVSIIILNFNGLGNIEALFASLRAHTTQQHEVIAIDNASTDGSRDFLRRQRDITLIENPSNLGVSTRNRAIALSRGNFVVFLDNDVVLTPGWLGGFLWHARKRPEIGLMGAVSNYAAGEQLVPDVRYESSEELNAFAHERRRDFRGQMKSTHRLVSFCVCMRRSVIDRIGGLDDRFGRFGFEDDDFALRAYSAGLGLGIAEDVFVHHTGGPQGRGNRTYNESMERAWGIFKQKWGLDPALAIGEPFDLRPQLERPFDPAFHYVALPSREEVLPFVYPPLAGNDT